MGQQTFLLRAGHIGPQALERRIAENKAKASSEPQSQRTGLMARMMERAEEAQKQRTQQAGRGGSGKRAPKKPPPKGKRRPSGGSSRPGPKPKRRGDDPGV